MKVNDFILNHMREQADKLKSESLSDVSDAFDEVIVVVQLLRENGVELNVGHYENLANKKQALKEVVKQKILSNELDNPFLCKTGEALYIDLTEEELAQ